MKEQILKGYVYTSDYCDVDNEEKTIYLLKGHLAYERDIVDFDNRKLSSLVSNALYALDYRNLTTEGEYEDGISDKRIANNVSMQLYASDKRESLDAIKESVVLNSLGIVAYTEVWHGWSEWTIESFELATFKLGGHDILDILRNLEGKYVYLVINNMNNDLEEAK